MLHLSGLNKGNITILNSEFTSNIASTGGGVIDIENTELEMILDFENNIFESNGAFAGGVYNVETTSQLQLICKNNTYTYNYATIGAVLTFRGSIQPELDSNLNILISNSNSYGNRASSKPF